MLPRVHRIRRGDTVFRYHRKTRAPLPNDVPEDHPRFIAAWAAEEAITGKAKAKPRGTPGSIEEGCALFLASGAFRDGAGEAYRAIMRRHIDAIRAKAGTARTADLRPYHIAADLDPLSPSVARQRLKTWRKLCAFWHAQGMSAEDPSRAVRGKAMPASEGHREWTADHVAAFRARWGLDTSQRLALELLQWTGARCIDAVRLGPGMVDRQGLLSFRQVKTGVEVVLPWTAPCGGLDAERVDLLTLTADCRHMVYLTTIHGKAKSHKSLSHWFSAAARAAGLDGLTAHGLRKYRMNRLAETGFSVLRMQAWVGHATLDEVEHYTRRAQRRAAWLGTDGERDPVNTSGAGRN